MSLKNVTYSIRRKLLLHEPKNILASGFASRLGGPQNLHNSYSSAGPAYEFLLDPLTLHWDDVMDFNITFVVKFIIQRVILDLICSSISPVNSFIDIYFQFS